jgi:hypothetical protein
VTGPADIRRLAHRADAHRAQQAYLQRRSRLPVCGGSRNRVQIPLDRHRFRRGAPGRHVVTGRPEAAAEPIARGPVNRTVWAFGRGRLAELLSSVTASITTTACLPYRLLRRVNAGTGPVLRYPSRPLEGGQRLRPRRVHRLLPVSRPASRTHRVAMFAGAPTTGDAVRAAVLRRRETAKIVPLSRNGSSKPWPPPTGTSLLNQPEHAWEGTLVRRRAAMRKACARSSSTPTAASRACLRSWLRCRIPSGASRLCQGLLHPRPAPPGPGCPQLRRPVATGSAVKDARLHSNRQRLTAHVDEGLETFSVHIECRRSSDHLSATVFAIPFIYALRHIDPTCQMAVGSWSGVRAGTGRVRRHAGDAIPTLVPGVAGSWRAADIRIDCAGHDLDMPGDRRVGWIRQVAGAAGHRRRRDAVGAFLSDGAVADGRQGN